MCGIIGVLNATYNSKIRKFLENGSIVGQVRGMDSTGMAQQMAGGVVKTHKMAVIGTYFASDKVTDKMLNDANSARYTFIHHRAATQGKINVANAHPFMIQRVGEPYGKETYVVGVHNGSLTNWRNKDNGDAYEVDSEWALSRIADVGDDAFKEIEGPYAFVWADTKEKDKVFMCRNFGRPLHAIFSKNRAQVYFASEAGMLAWLVERNDIETESEVLQLQAGQIYEFDTSGSTVTVKSKAAPAPAVKPAVVITPLVTKTKDVEPKHMNYGTPTVNRSLYSNVPGEAQKRFIDSLKAAAKGKPAESDEKEEIVQQRTDDAPQTSPDVDEVPTTWYNDRSVSDSEKEAAKKAGIFRELNWLEGAAWDEDTGDLLGDVKIFTPGKGATTYVGVLRGISQARAHSQFIENGDASKRKLAGDWVVVLGMRSDPVCGNVVIVSELTQEGRRELAKQHAV